MSTNPIGDPRKAGEEGPAGDLRKAGEAGPAGDTRVAGQAEPKVTTKTDKSDAKQSSKGSRSRK